jgi:CRP-like cAMP-binding protein
VSEEAVLVTTDALRTCEVFAGLTDEELAQIISFCREESYAKDTIMFHEGDPADRFFVVQEGRISIQYVICPQPDYCQDARIVLDKPGQFLGWSSLVKPRRMTASAYCVTDVRLIGVDSKRLNELMEENSHVGFVIMKELAGAINNLLKDAKGLTFQRLMGSL